MSALRSMGRWVRMYVGDVAILLLLVGTLFAVRGRPDQAAAGFPAAIGLLCLWHLQSARDRVDRSKLLDELWALRGENQRLKHERDWR